ncbi:hypothetical protein LI003_24115, partial [Bacteroides caccae]|uniref:hypothetical protein n=1 Tax=Bacteroides caccae TaxID=47678 RepID=UPI001D08FF13
TVVDQGTLLDTMSFPLGSNLVARTVAEKFSIPIEAAVSKLQLGITGMQHLAAREKIDSVVGEAGARWV